MQIKSIQAGKRYRDLWAIRQITLTLPLGSPLLLLGPSGGGKSTLLRLLAGLEIADEGSIQVDGIPLPPHEATLRDYRRRLGFVFQEGNLFPHLTAEENITLPLRYAHHQSAAEAKERAQSLLTRFQLLPHAHKKPAELSGGQRQRIALARALGHQPEILFLDEPTSALDPEMTAEVLDALSDVKREGRTLILATHATGFARRTGGTVAFLRNHQLEWLGPTAEFFAQPPTPGAAGYLARILRD